MEEYRAELDPERNAGGQTNIFPVHNFFPKLKMAAAAILDLLGEPWDHPRRHTCGAYSLLKFCRDRISSFQVIRV